MRISHSHKYIFLSNFKSGSTSIREVLDLTSQIKGTNIGYPYLRGQALITFLRNIGLQTGPYQTHTGANALKAHFVKKGWNWNDYFHFTTIRNPLDKLVSLYNYADKMKYHELKFIKETSISFREFVLNPKVIDMPNMHIETYILDSNNKQIIENIYPIEHINSYIDSISENLGFSIPKVPIKNSTLKSKQSDIQFDEELLSIIRSKFRMDLKIGSYEI